MNKYRNVYESKHPLVKSYLTDARVKDTQPPEFRSAIEKITRILAIEATAELKLKQIEIETPLTKCVGHELSEKIALVPVLRAGIGMCSTLLQIIEDATVWYLGMYRDEETLKPVSYYNKLPSDSPPDICFVLDPMLATGGTLLAVLTELSKWGVKESVVISIIAAPEGISTVHADFPDTKIYVGAVDERLTKDDPKYPDGFIWPGLGDAGDRLHGTL